jgi:serine/threonine protein kinase
MPPEQCDPASWPGHVGPAADVWGLGATLHHAISGEVPFPRIRGASKSGDPKIRFPQLVADPARLPKHVPAPLQDLVLSMLARNPAERPAAAQVASLLEPLVVSLPRKLTISRRGVHLR